MVMGARRLYAGSLLVCHRAAERQERTADASQLYDGSPTAHSPIVNQPPLSPPLPIPDIEPYESASCLLDDGGDQSVTTHGSFPDSVASPG